MKESEVAAVFIILAIVNIVIFAVLYDGETNDVVFFSLGSTVAETMLICAVFWAIEHIRFV